MSSILEDDLRMVQSPIQTLRLLGRTRDAVVGVGVAVAALSALGIESSIAQERSVLYADLSIQFECSHIQREELENAVEQFLAKQKFKTLNQGRLQRQHHYPGTVNLVGLDDGQRIINVVALLYPDIRYAATVHSPPPTKRASALEDALQKFVTQDLRCEIKQIDRSENPAAAKDLHQNQVSRVRKLLREAEVLKGHRKS